MSKIFPNLPLTGDFACGEDALASMNKNIETLDNLVLQGIENIGFGLPSLAGLPDGYAAINTDDNTVNVLVDGAWVSYTPKAGWFFLSAPSATSLLVFDGATWLDKPLLTSLGNLITNAGNLGTGTGVFESIALGVAQFKSLIAGGGISISNTGTEITITSTALNDAQPVGSGESIIKQITGFQVAELKTLVAGTGITLTSSADEILIESDAPELTIQTPAQGTTFIIDPADPTDMYLVSASPSFPYSEIHLPDPALTPIGKQVIIKARAVSAFPLGMTIKSETGANYIEAGTSASTGGSGGFALVNSVPMSVGMSLTYVNSGTQWLIINEVKSE